VKKKPKKKNKVGEITVGKRVLHRHPLFIDLIGRKKKKEWAGKAVGRTRKKGKRRGKNKNMGSRREKNEGGEGKDRQGAFSV